MKKFSIILLILVGILLLTGLADASGAPRRYVTKVEDVFKPYTPDGWIISSDEEAAGDQKVSNAPECDIRGIISCYDEEYLRIDILLNNSITLKWDTLFGICLEYDDMNEYYIYETLTGKLVYQKEKNGKIIETKDLTAENTGDTAGITSSDQFEKADVYFIINKEKHINGEQGQRYFLTSYFWSGFYNDAGEIKIADDTIDVDLEFEY